MASNIKYPLVSIAIPTFNSERTLALTLESIKKQSYPQNRIEILLIDGMSTDGTRDIAKKYKCKIIPNPKVDLIYGKHIGFLQARGKYLVNLDSDEVMANPKSLEKKVQLFVKNNSVKGVMSSSLTTPSDSAFINYYINDFGEPFSYFMHRLSSHPDHFIRRLKQIGRIVCEDKDGVVINFSSTSPLPIVELTGTGGMVDIVYLRREFPKIYKNPSLVLFYFYFLNSDHKDLGVTKNDHILHYSSASLKKYVKKILSRVKNNVYETQMGQAGFVGREQFQPAAFKYKKYLFILYSLSLILPAIESLYLIYSRKNAVYLIHLPMCLFVTFAIMYYFTLKTLGMSPVIKSYGN